MRPAMVFRSVLLPAPLAPITAMIWPASTLSETPNSAWQSPPTASTAPTPTSPRLGAATHIDLRHLRASEHGMWIAVRDGLARVEHEGWIDNCEQGMDDGLDPDDRNAAC